PPLGDARATVAVAPRRDQHPLLFLYAGSRARGQLPSFPTRRSSDLNRPPRTPPESGAHGGRRGPHGEHDERGAEQRDADPSGDGDRKSTRLNSSHVKISYAVFCLKKKRSTRNDGAESGSRCAEPPPS